MEAARSSGIMVEIYYTTDRHVPEDITKKKIKAILVTDRGGQ
jgi:hypothetical protein